MPFSFHRLRQWGHICCECGMLTVGDVNSFAIERQAVSSLESSIHQLSCHTASATVTGKKQSFNEAFGIDFPSEPAPHCAGSDVGQRHVYIGSDVEDGGQGRASGMHRWHSHRRHLDQTFAVPGALTNVSTATESYPRDEHLGEEEALPHRFDGCLGPLYVLPLRGLTECSLYDELYIDLAWCEWCRTFTCPDCVRIMARLPTYGSSDDSELSDWDSAVSRGVAVAMPLQKYVTQTRRLGRLNSFSWCRCRCAIPGSR